jgi:hypothetical protein
VQVVAHAVHEELPRALTGVRHVRPRFAEGLLQLRRHAQHLVLGEQPGHLARAQQRVDRLQHLAAGDLVLGQQEHGLLALLPRLAVQCAQVLVQLRLPVLLGQRDLEGRAAAGDERAQPRQRLLARAAHADEKAGAARRLKQARDAQQVAQRVVEQHQHGLRARRRHLLPLPGDEELDALAQALQRPGWLVHLGRLRHQLAVLVQLVVAQEAGHEAGQLAGPAVARELFAEGGAREFVHAPAVEAAVGLRAQLVAEDALALVPPQRQQHDARLRPQQPARADGRAAGLDGGERRQQHALEHARELAHVEDVVELGRRRQQPLAHGSPQRDGGAGQRHGRLARQRTDLRLREAAVQHAAVDAVDGGQRRRLHAEHEEVPLQPRGHVVSAAAGRGHSAHPEQVLAHLEVAALVRLQEAHHGVLHQQPRELQRGLVAPFVGQRHAHVVQEHRHLLAVGRAEVLAAALVQLPLDGGLEHEGRGGAGEVDSLHQPAGAARGAVVPAVGVEEHERRGGLGGATSAHHRHRPPLLVQQVQKQGRARGVHGRHQQVGEVECGGGPCGRELPRLRLPRLPLQRGRVHGPVIHQAAVGARRAAPLGLLRLRCGCGALLRPPLARELSGYRIRVLATPGGGGSDGGGDDGAPRHGAVLVRRTQA